MKKFIKSFSKSKKQPPADAQKPQLKSVASSGAASVSVRSEPLHAYKLPAPEQQTVPAVPTRPPQLPPQQPQHQQTEQRQQQQHYATPPPERAPSARPPAQDAPPSVTRLTENNVAAISPISPQRSSGWDTQSRGWEVESRASSAATAQTGHIRMLGRSPGANSPSRTGSAAGMAYGGMARPPAASRQLSPDMHPRHSPVPMRRSPPEASPAYSSSPSPSSGRRLPPRQLIIPAADDEDAPLASETDNVKVFVRTRPINQREVEMGGHPVVEVVGNRTVRLLTSPQPSQYSFDCVAGEAFSQEALFEVVGRPVVNNCMSGYNSCIFAYGQTGSGKTYTMLGSGFEPCHSADDPITQMRGLTPRVFEDLFARIEELKANVEAGSTRECVLRCSFLEIYNEVLTDLLNPESTHLQIREDVKLGIYVEHLSEHTVTSLRHVSELLERGQLNRKIGETMMNADSSRSHSVFTCILECKTTDESGITHLLSSRLNLVDLAGSERQRQSGATGERLKEASGINVSLTVLGQVIMALVDAQHGRRRHVPYRNSRLTFLLQDSLGGNSKTMMIANISPASPNLADTHSTLRFAQRVKAIRNTAVRNEDTRGDAAQLRLEIRRIKQQLQAWKDAALAAGVAPDGFAGPESGGSGDVRTASSSRGSSRRGSNQRKGSTLNPAAWDELASMPGSQEPGAGHAAMASALRREAAALADGRRVARELEAAQALAAEREADNQRLRMIVKLKEGMVARLERTINAPEDFTFGAAEKETTIRELREEIRIVRARMENNPEVKRYAAETLALSTELARLREYVHKGEREALLADVDVLRAELLRVAEALERMQALPQVKELEVAAARAAHDGTLQIEAALAEAASRTLTVAEVAELRGRLLEEQTAATDAIAARRAAEAELEASRAQQQAAAEAVAARERLEQQLLAARAELAEVRRLSQLTTATGSGESATQPPPSAVIEDGAPAVVSADTAWDDDSPILATGTGAAEEPAAATASLPETEAVSHQTDVQGLDDREDDSESRFTSTATNGQSGPDVMLSRGVSAIETPIDLTSLSAIVGMEPADAKASVGAETPSPKTVEAFALTEDDFNEEQQSQSGHDRDLVDRILTSDVSEDLKHLLASLDPAAATVDMSQRQALPRDDQKSAQLAED